jgi:hypothetical protein
MTKGNASTNIQWMGAIQLIIFERLATTKRVVHQRKLAAVLYELASRAAELKFGCSSQKGTRVMLDEMGPHPTPRDSFGVVFICTEPTVSAR